MRKDAAQAADKIRALGWVLAYHDSKNHAVFHHPSCDDEVRLSLSPSDSHGPAKSVAQAHKFLGLAQVTNKRRSAEVRAEETARLRRREALARAVAANQRNREILDANRRRQLMADEDRFNFYDRLMRSGPARA